MFDGENEDAGGLLMRLEALYWLGDRNGTLAAAQFMLSLLFMSVELPVLMKLLSSFSPPTAYDRLAALRDSGDVEIEEMAQESRKSVALAKEELLVMAEEGAGRPGRRRRLLPGAGRRWPTSRRGPRRLRRRRPRRGCYGGAAAGCSTPGRSASWRATPRSGRCAPCAAVPRTVSTSL